MRDYKDYIIGWIIRGFHDVGKVPNFNNYTFGHNWNSYLPLALKSSIHKEVHSGIYEALKILFTYKEWKLDWRVQELITWLEEDGLKPPKGSFQPTVSSAQWLIYHFLKLQEALDNAKLAVLGEN